MSEEKPTIPHVSITTYRGNISEKTECEFTEDSGPLKCSCAALSVPIPTLQSRCTHTRISVVPTLTQDALKKLSFCSSFYDATFIWCSDVVSDFLSIFSCYLLYSMLKSRLWPASWMFTFFLKANIMCISCLNNPSQL